MDDSWMRRITRREALAGSLSPAACGQVAQKVHRAGAIDQALQAAVEREGVPGAVAMVATPDRITYQGAFGRLSTAGGTAMPQDAIFRILSMTKPVTSVAALQLVERGKLRLEDPVQKFLPSVAEVKILTESGDLRPPKTPITVRHLLTHTSGYAYPYWSKRFREYTQKPSQTKAASPVLMFDPGEQWLYGTSTDVLGRAIESVSNQSLEDYFRANIFDQLGMSHTAFNVPPMSSESLASLYQREANGRLREFERKAPKPVSEFNGGGGLYSTAGDYVAFMQMILRGGMAGSSRILQSRTVEMMTRNQIGTLDTGRLSTAWPELSNDLDFHPGFKDKFGFGFLINSAAYEGGRSRGSLAWAGLANTYFWIDLRKKLCAVLLMQIFPFLDTAAVAVLRKFEKTVYATE